jgi:hypothetical protein
LLRNAIIWNRSSMVREDEVGGLEDGAVGPEGDGGAGATAGRIADHLELGALRAPVGELDVVALAVAVDLDHHPLGQALTTETPTPWRPPDTL